MIHSKKVFVLLLIMCFYSCQGESETAILHQQAFEKQEQVIQTIKEIRQLLKADTSGTNAALLSEIHEIEEAIFVIPGHTLKLPGHEGHDHGHDRPKLSAKEILTLQEDMLLQIKKIKSQITND